MFFLFVVALNRFADLTSQEYASYYLNKGIGKRPATRAEQCVFAVCSCGCYYSSYIYIHFSEFASKGTRANPTTVDWRTNGAVTRMSSLSLLCSSIKGGGYV